VPLLTKFLANTFESTNRQLEGRPYFEVRHRRKGDSEMRVIIISAMLVGLLSLGGCFHHTQAVSVEPIATPMK
jgi:hypothetical protein